MPTSVEKHLPTVLQAGAGAPRREPAGAAALLWREGSQERLCALTYPLRDAPGARPALSRSRERVGVSKANGG